MRIHRSKSSKTPDFKSPFAPLQLAVEDEAQLEAVARLFVQNTVVQFEKFIQADCRKVDSNSWKCIKHERGLRVFLQRRRKDVERRMRRRQRLRSFRHRGSEATEISDAETFSPSMGSRDSSCSSVSSFFSRRTGSFTSNYSSSSTNSSDSRATTINGTDVSSPSSLGLELPILQLVGSIPGCLEDAMFGSLGATSDAMRVKNAYDDDNTTDGAVLATIVSPTTTDPFRSLTIKWVEQEGPTLDHHRYHPLHYPVTLPGASTREDLIFLEATGMMTLASGERVGYQLRHSVHFPQTHARPNVRRGNMSMCTLFREVTTTTNDGFDGPVGGFLEVFARSCLSGGNAAVRSTTNAMAATGSVVLCGRMKKLAWMLAQRQPPRTQQPLFGLPQQTTLAAMTRSLPERKARNASLTVTVSAAAAAVNATIDSKLCVTCKKKGPWFSSSKKKKPATTCQLCWRYVCSSCRLKKTVMSCMTAPRRVDNDDRMRTHVLQREVTLCNICVHQAMVATSARDVAREEIEADPKRWRFPSPIHRERVSDSCLHSSFMGQMPSSLRSAGTIRPITGPSMAIRAELAVNDVFQRCA